MATFEHLRISLARPASAPLLEQIGHEEAPISRRDYLAGAFGETRSFIHGRHVFGFAPMVAPAGYAAGFFGRGVKLKGKKGLDQKYAPETIQTNDSVLFVIDLADNSQIAMMEHKNTVGSPKAVLDAFLMSLRRGNDGLRDYEPHVKYISSEENYWSAVKRWQGHITQIDFTFIPPNALQSSQKVMDFIREASRDAHSDTLQHRYKSNTGNLNPEAPIIAGSVDVALNGGGETVVKSGGKIIFSSSESKMTTDIPSDEVPTSAEASLIPSFIRRIFGVKDRDD
jgi:hypothetical protein